MRRVLVLGPLAALALSGCEFDSQDPPDPIHRMNTICGAPPVRITHHGPGTNRPYWLVYCKDGTVRIVGPDA